MIAPDLADKMIPNLTADTAFDRPAFNQLVQAFLGLRDSSGGPTFETLPWKMGDSVGSFLVVKQPEADAVLAVLRGQAPIPTTTTAAARGRRLRLRRHDGAEREGVRRAGAGAQRLRGAERGGEHLAGPRGEGFRARRRGERPPRHHRPRPRSGTPRPTSPRPSCSPPTCPTPSWCRTPRSPAPTSCWPWARASAGSAAVRRPPRARRRPLRPHCRPKLPVSSRGAPTRCPPHHQHPPSSRWNGFMGRFVISLALGERVRGRRGRGGEPRHQRPGQEHPAGGRAEGRAARRPVAPTT